MIERISDTLYLNNTVSASILGTLSIASLGLLWTGVVAFSPFTFAASNVLIGLGLVTVGSNTINNDWRAARSLAAPLGVVVSAVLGHGVMLGLAALIPFSIIPVVSTCVPASVASIAFTTASFVLSTTALRFMASAIVIGLKNCDFFSNIFMGITEGTTLTVFYFAFSGVGGLLAGSAFMNSIPFFSAVSDTLAGSGISTILGMAAWRFILLDKIQKLSANVEQVVKQMFCITPQGAEIG